MYHTTETTSQRQSLSECISRKSSFSERLNKLKSNPFSRRRTSSTLASSESLSGSRRKSYIPTPSFGSRTSSLFGDFKVKPADDTQSSKEQRNDRAGNRNRRSTLDSRRQSRQASESTSSFFGNQNSSTLYPKEFLEDPESRTGGKENEKRSLRHTESTHELCQLSEDLSQGSPQSLLGRGSLAATIEESCSTDQGHLIGGVEDFTPTAPTTPRSISNRLANATVEKLHSVRHSLAAIPQSCSPKSKSYKSDALIQERRLMAPLNPPLPRSSTIGAVPNIASAFTSAHQSTSRTPSFMRPTSSSAARKSLPSKSFKSPPPPLTLTSGAKTDMPGGFSQHRESKRAAVNPYLGAHRSFYGPYTGPQMNVIDADLKPKPVYETEKQVVARHEATKRAATSERIPDSTSSEEANSNSKSLSAQRDRIYPERYSSDPRYMSTPEFYAKYAIEDELFMPNVSQQLALNEDPDILNHQNKAIVARHRKRTSAVHSPNQVGNSSLRASGRARPSPVFQCQGPMQTALGGPIGLMPTKFSPATGLSNRPYSSSSRQGAPSRIPRSTSKTGGLQQSVSEYHLPSVSRARNLSTANKPSLNEKPLPAVPPETQWQNDNDPVSLANEHQQGITKSSDGETVHYQYPPRKTSLGPVQLTRSNFSSVELDSYVSASYPDDDMFTPTSMSPQAWLSAPANDELNEADPTLVKEAQDPRYWAGRCTAINDRLRNEAPASSGANFNNHHDSARHDRVVKLLQEKCVTREAEKSLFAFVDVWREGWTGGATGGGKPTLNVVPKIATPAIVEMGGKKGLMGKVFGKKKS